MNKPESIKVSIKINEVSKSRILEVIKNTKKASTEHTDKKDITRVKR